MKEVSYYVQYKDMKGEPAWAKKLRLAREEYDQYVAQHGQAAYYQMVDKRDAAIKLRTGEAMGAKKATPETRSVIKK